MTSPVDKLISCRTGVSEITTADLAWWQLEKAKETVSYAKTSGRFYHNHLQNIDVSDINTVSDLNQLPFTYAADLAGSYKDFLCVPPSKVARIVTLFTSGSTGPSKRVCFTERDLEATADFFAHGMSQMVREGQSAAIFMDGLTPYSVGDMLRISLSRIGVKPLLWGCIKDVCTAAQAANSCSCLTGIPAQMLQLARLYPHLRPKAVLLSADYVPEAVINSLIKLWNTEVYTHYGMTEMGFGGGVECCCHDGYHMRHMDMLIEVIDPSSGKQLKPGEAGEVVITTLNREAMPLIRYRTGDMASVLVTPCGCGSILPRLSKVTGRIKEAAKGWPTITTLDEIIYMNEAVLAYEASIDTKKTLRISIEALDNFDTTEITEQIYQKTKFSGNIKTEFRTCIPIAGSGKRRIILL